MIVFVFSPTATGNDSLVPMGSEDYKKTQEALRAKYGWWSDSSISKKASKDEKVQRTIWCSWVCTENEIKKYQTEHWLKVDWIIWAETLNVVIDNLKNVTYSWNDNVEDAAKADAEHAENMACSYDGQTDIMQAMKGCVTSWDGLSLVWVDEWDLKVWTGFKAKIMDWTKKIGWFLGLGAIFAIAFGSLKMTLSRWEEEEIKKGKDIIKWWVLWFLLVVSAGAIVWIMVNIIYWVLW